MRMLVMIPKVIWIIMGAAAVKKTCESILRHEDVLFLFADTATSMYQVHGEGHESEWNNHGECGKVPGLLISTGVRHHQQMLRIEDHFLLSQVSFCPLSLIIPCTGS
jgi:hypothetical protein